MKRTFDEFVESNADAERAAAILANPFYQSLSSSFAGTQEYMAMEKLGPAARARGGRGPWDLIVVDTPPSRSALDFLDAPRRLGSFLDGRFIRLLAAPGQGGRPRRASKVIAAGFGMFTSVLTQGHRRARCSPTCRPSSARSTRSSAASASGPTRPTRMLQAADTAFVVVAAPERDALREASYFVERLEADDDAAGRAGAQPGADHRRCPSSTPPTATVGGGAARDRGAVVGDGGAAAHPRRPGGDPGPPAPARRAVHLGAPRRCAVADGARDGRRRRRPRRVCAPWATRWPTRA